MPNSVAGSKGNAPGLAAMEDIEDVSSEMLLMAAAVEPSLSSGW